MEGKSNNNDLMWELTEQHMKQPSRLDANGSTWVLMKNCNGTRPSQLLLVSHMT